MNYIYEIILLLTLFKSIVLVRKFSLSSQNYLFVYLLATFLVELISEIILYQNSNSQYSFHYFVYSVFCILFFLFYYSRLFNKNLRNKISLLSLIPLMYILISTLFLEKDLKSELFIVLPMFYILYTMMWFYQKINSPSETKITDDPNFWISTGILLWSCFFIFRVIPRYFLKTKDNSFLDLLIEFQFVINCIMYLLFFKALLKYETISKNIKKSDQWTQP